MKYTIEGFSQEEAIKIGLDVIDLALLRWIIDFHSTGAMEMRHFEEKSFFWVCYDALLRDMPILGINNNTSLGRRFKRMVKSGLLEFRIFQTKHGSKSFYMFNPDCLTKLLSKKTNIDKPLDSKVKRSLTQKSSGACFKSQVLYIDPSTNDHNTNDTNIRVFFDYFCLKTKKQYKLTPERKDIIKKRLVEGYTLDQLKLAVDNFVRDPWPDRINNLDLLYCLGKQRGKPDSLEKWIYFVPKISTSNNASEGPGETSKKATISDSMLEERFGRIATKDMIKKFLREMPEQLWWKVDKFLRRRYPGSNGSSFSEAEREVIAEARVNRESFTKMAQGMGKQI